LNGPFLAFFLAVRWRFDLRRLLFSRKFSLCRTFSGQPRGSCAQAVFSDGAARWNVEASSRIACPAPALCCRDWFGGRQNLALTARMKAEAFPTLEIFLSTIFLSNL
jgi:hypothetical protein